MSLLTHEWLSRPVQKNAKPRLFSFSLAAVVSFIQENPTPSIFLRRRSGAMKNKLMSSAPWRGEEEAQQFEGANLKVTNQPGSTPTMLVPGQKKSVASKSKPREPIAEIDPELRYSFQRNTQVMPWFLFTFFFKNKILVSLSCEKYCFSQVLCFFTCGGWFTQFSLYYTCNLIF